MGVAASVGPKRARPGPRDNRMREARVCYDHLAGDHAVAMLDGFLARGLLRRNGEEISLGKTAPAHFAAIGIDTTAFEGQRRPICRACLDWSVRRSHLAGSLGAAILDRMLSAKWARREPEGRAIVFSPKGKIAFAKTFLSD